MGARLEHGGIGLADALTEVSGLVSAQAYFIQAQPVTSGRAWAAIATDEPDTETYPSVLLSERPSHFTLSAGEGLWVWRSTGWSGVVVVIEVNT